MGAPSVALARRALEVAAPVAQTGDDEQGGEGEQAGAEQRLGDRGQGRLDVGEHPGQEPASGELRAGR
jgi:hypothetical protein